MQSYHAAVQSIRRMTTPPKFIRKLSFWNRIVILLIILMTVIWFLKVKVPTSFSVQEGFGSDRKDGIQVDSPSAPFDRRTTTETIYDTFYSSVYDQLIRSEPKDLFEVKLLMDKTNLSKKQSRILDIGSGTGHQAGILSKQGYKVVGLDSAKAMISRAKKVYPNVDFQLGNATNNMLYESGAFSHIMLLYFSIYYIKNKKQLFDNCFSWLAPGGYMLLHTVNRDKFDPILPSGSPFYIIPPQKYAKTRVTETSVVFDKFKYKADFKLNGDTAKFVETFVQNEPVDGVTQPVRQNEHTLFMTSQQSILDQAMNAGFIISSASRMTKIGYEHQSITVLQKPV